MPASNSSDSWVVLKFGGTSVANQQCWKNIHSIVSRHLEQGRKPIVVCSAPSGVSNQLETLVAQAANGQAKDCLAELHQTYQSLATELALDCGAYLKEKFLELTQLIDGINLLGEVSPRVQARVMAFGELMLTHLGSMYLSQQGLASHWQDVRDWLMSEKHADFRHPDAYLSARCNSDPDQPLQDKLEALTGDVIVTQGFIANNTKGETVLLGRGGSDSTAAYLAAKINAQACEIWTDVPGIYTANPKAIPQARLISSLDYDEAQEIASMGAKVLHPKCITPVKGGQIPLMIRYTKNPERSGTMISARDYSGDSQIKSILTKHNIILISIETVKMWQQVGFLAEVFESFKRHGVSIDLISTSESTVTVSLDGLDTVKDPHVLDHLVADINTFARAKVIAPCASVSLVGRNIRSILHQLGGVFSLFEEQQIYLLSQAANDLNLTFVVDEEQATRLAVKLHQLLIEQYHESPHFQLSWEEEFGQTLALQSPWYESQKSELLAVANTQSPCYLYSKAILQRQADGLRSCDALNRVYYSIKANSNTEVLQQLYQSGFGFECVSLEELHHIFKLFPEIDKTRILFTPNFAAKAEYQAALDKGVRVTLDSLYPFQAWPELFSGKDILIRVDIGKGSGHHKYVITGGDQSKFGIPLTFIGEVKTIAAEHQINIVGLHSHAGSGILKPDHWASVFTRLATLAQDFPNVSIINVGGGLGIVEKPGQQALDLAQLNQSLLQAKSQFPQYELWMEPGRYLVAESGVLLAKVTQVKRKGELTFVGIETGMNSLIRPALYGAYHNIINLTKLGEPNTERVNIVGPICESGDTLGYSRLLPACEEGDVILIANVGAYGYSMSSRYNLREPAKEIMV